MQKTYTENTWNHWHFDVSITDHLPVDTVYEQVIAIKIKALVMA